MGKIKISSQSNLTIEKVRIYLEKEYSEENITILSIDWIDEYKCSIYAILKEEWMAQREN